MGSKIKKCKKRSIIINTSSISSISHIILLKNDKRFKIFNIKSKKIIKKSIKGSLEIAWGWGNKNSIIKWNGEIKLERGKIIDLHSCFRGIPKLEPNQKFNLNNISLINEISRKENIVFFKSYTTGNYSLKDPGYQSFKIKITSPENDNIILKINNENYKLSIKNIIKNGSKVFYIRGWLNELIKIGPFNFKDELSFSKKIIDEKPILKIDRYRVEVIQNNGNRAWSSPIWVYN